MTINLAKGEKLQIIPWGMQRNERIVNLIGKAKPDGISWLHFRADNLVEWINIVIIKG